MALTKQQILAQFAVRRYDEVDGIRIQSLTELEQSKLEALWANRYGKSREIDPVMRRELLSCCIVDDNGERMFDSSPESLEAIGSLDSAVVDKIYDKCRILCGMDQPAVDTGKLGKASAETTDSD